MAEAVFRYRPCPPSALPLHIADFFPFRHTVGKHGLAHRFDAIDSYLASTLSSADFSPVLELADIMSGRPQTPDPPGRVPSTVFPLCIVPAKSTKKTFTSLIISSLWILPI